MINLNDKMDIKEEEDRSDNLEKDSQNQIEFYNLNYNVNYFGQGRETEDWQ